MDWESVALVGESHQEALLGVLDSFRNVRDGHGARLHLVVGERGFGASRLLREVFESLVDEHDADGFYNDTLPPGELHPKHAPISHASAAIPFVWWAPTPGLMNTGLLDAMVGPEVRQKIYETITKDHNRTTLELILQMTPGFGNVMNGVEVVRTMRDRVALERAQLASGLSLEDRVLPIVSALIAASDTCPVLLVLDDAQATDAATCLMIRMILATSGLRVLVVAAGHAGILAEQSSRPGGESLCLGKLAGDPPRRQEWSGGMPTTVRPVTVTAVAPLHRADVAMLAKAAGVISQDVINRAWEWSGGIPHLTTLVIDRLAAGAEDPLEPSTLDNPLWRYLHAEVSRDLLGSPETPPTISPEARRLAELAAASTFREVSFDALAGVTAATTPATKARVDQLVQAGWMVVSGEDSAAWRTTAQRRFVVKLRELTPAELDVVVALRHRLASRPEIADVVPRLAWASTQAQRAAVASAGHSASPAFARWVGGLPTMPGGTDQPTAQAIWAAEREVELVEQLWGEGYELAVSLRRLGLAYEHANAWDRAIEALRRAHQMAVTRCGRDDPLEETLDVELGRVAHDGGHYSVAIESRTRVAARSASRLGRRHPDTIWGRALLAHSYASAGQILDAIRLQESVVVDSDIALGGFHGIGLVHRADLAGFYGYAGRLREAIALQERALSDSVATLGDNDLATLGHRANLGHHYRQAGRISESITLMEHVLDRKAAQFGIRHPETLTTRANLAVAYREAGWIAQAITLQEEVLEDRILHFGDQHPDTLVSRSSLAVAYRHAGRAADAIALLQGVLANQTVHLGRSHYETIRSQANLAHAYRSANRLSEAIPLLEQSVAVARTLGYTHPDLDRWEQDLASWQAEAEAT